MMTFSLALLRSSAITGFASASLMMRGGARLRRRSYPTGSQANRHRCVYLWLFTDDERRH